MKNTKLQQNYNPKHIKMFRGSAYSIQTDKDIINKSQLLQQQIRIAMIGIGDVGKSSMLACISNEKFREDINSTIGFLLRFKKLRMNNYAINLYVWDGAGERMGQFLDEGRFDQMDGILEVFDLTHKQSFHQLEQLHHNLKNRYTKNNKVLCSVLVGNKVDDIKQATQLMESSKQIDYLADKFAKRQEMLYLKTSAKKNSSVKDSYIELIKQILFIRCRGRTSRIFNQEQQIGPTNQKGPEASCSCCRSLGSCKICAIF